MLPRHTRGWVLSLSILAGLLRWGDARADWPIARQNPQRTGFATGTSDIEIPVPFWRYYLGGFVGQPNLRPYDVDDDGISELLAVTGGRAIAKRLSDETRWETPPLDLVQLVDLVDLDGDGTPEMVARSTSRVHVISLSDGSVLWSEPSEQMGTIGGVRIGDVSGDGVDDLVIGECGCCSVNSGLAGVVYSFAGNLSAPTLLWTLPINSCGGSSQSLTLVNMDATPGLDIVLGERSKISVMSGVTGNVFAATDTLGDWLQRSECVGANIDGEPGDELICALSSNLPPATNQRRAFALKYDPGATPSLRVLWSTALAPDAGDLAWTDLVTDATGDGLLEVIVSARELDGSWSTKVVAAESGQILATIPNTIARGVVATLPGSPLLLTATDTHLTAWRATRTSAPVQLWTIQNADVVTVWDPSARRRTRLYERVLSADVDGDGRPDLLTRTIDGSAITAYSTSTSAAAPLGSFAFPAGRRLVNAWPTSTAGLGVLAVLGSDGIVHVLDRSLVPLTSSDDVVAPGLRFGGYYLSGDWRKLESTMVAGPLDLSGTDSIVARDSRGALVRLDAAFASFASPPRTRWSKPDAFSPSIVPDLVDGGPGVACFALEQPVAADPVYKIEALSPTGTPTWSSTVPKRPLNDILPGHFDSVAGLDLVYEWGDPGDTLVRKRAISGATGGQIWESPALDAGCARQPAGLSIGNWNDDGFDDIYHQTRATRVMSGLDGAELFSGGPNACYFQPLLSNLDGDPRHEITLQGGVAPAQTLDDDLTTVLWTSSEDDKPVPYGSMITCPGETRLLVEGSWLYPARLKITTLSGADTGAETTIVLAGGLSYSNETEAVAAGKNLSQLGSVAAHSNLRGNGEPIALIGARDGWLYGYEPCVGQLAMVYKLNAPVGTPIFGDTDGDGKDEILVSVADGYLYALRNLTIAQPGFVWDTDPEAGITDRDINAIATTDRLSARWQAVPGATSYEITVVNLDGDYLIDPFWRDVGNVTEVTIVGLPLQDRMAYRFAVRAIAPGGRSVDTVSNGVVVSTPPDSDGSSDAGTSTRTPGGCCDSRGAPGETGGLLLLLSCVAFALRQRAR